MAGLFIFTAAKKEARMHWQTSILRPLDPSTVYRLFPDSAHGQLRRIEAISDRPSRTYRANADG